MKNLWPQSFKESDFEPPKSIFVEQAKLLPTLTGDLVYAEVAELSYERAHYDGMSGDFAYTFILTGKFLQKYSYRVLSFSHGISFYPVQLNINSEIRTELGIKEIHVKIGSPKEVELLLQKILTSNTVSQVIGAIMKMSK